MKHPTGSARPRRAAAPKAPPKKLVRLDLKRRPVAPEPEELVIDRPKSSFWKWVLLVALLHLIAIGLISLYYEFSARMTPPPPQFISLLPEGDVVKGTPGQQQAAKVGTATTLASVHHHHAKPQPAQTVAQKTPLTPPPLAKLDPTSPDKAPLTPAPVKHHVPKPPKIKVDLQLADGPTSPDKPKPKLLAKKPVLRTPDDDESHDTESAPDSNGLSKEQIAEKLGEKLDAAGTANATQTGKSGSTHAQSNNFSEFYDMIRDQVMGQWQSPNLSDETAVNPVVQIHVEKDGRVPPASVQLVQSSGNASYDESAVTAAKNLGYLREPLPEGCNPDIPITFKLTR